ncbi:LytR family transcriptional regulator [Nocardioides jishulii]|uniref:LytR family transcriptional regulator n=2 Tax=Nocardioides jishulii TaxID=2575440 RepID=A0A4U2YXM4_9ACTN|nr:LytR family transcriptional regulator [Nocardioides jishulii]TKI64941.1 LytR family transcriptional regulator [Nocardioides jishulii]
MRRNERGVAFPSPVVMLSVIAVAMAGFAFVATKDAPEAERKVENVAQSAPTPTPDPTPSATPTKKAKPKPKLDRSKVYVEVYNNSGVKGLAGRTASQITAAGWQVVGSDNWVGHIPEPTVYHPPRLKAAAKQLALDLGIRRTKEAVPPMKLDRLTVILTG